MEKAFIVSFQLGGVYCSNICYGENIDAVMDKYNEKYNWVSASPAKDWEIKEAWKKGKPVYSLSAMPW